MICHVVRCQERKWGTLLLERLFDAIVARIVIYKRIHDFESYPGQMGCILLKLSVRWLHRLFLVAEVGFSGARFGYVLATLLLSNISLAQLVLKRPPLTRFQLITCFFLDILCPIRDPIQTIETLLKMLSYTLGVPLACHYISNSPDCGGVNQGTRKGLKTIAYLI